MYNSPNEQLVFSKDERRGGRVAGSSWKIHLALAGTAVNLIIFVMFVAFFSASLSAMQKAAKATSGTSVQSQEPVHLTVDMTQLKGCPTSPAASDLPCLQKDGRYLTSERSLGPWKCNPTGVAAFTDCPALNDSAAAISRAGVYLIVAQTVVVDSLPSPVALLLTANDKTVSACVHNVTGSQLPCSIIVIKRLDAGDKINVRLPQAYRLIDPHFSITYVDLVRLSD